ncbi:4Fe-4S dicluster domain-containing protein [Anaeromyxobacter oryzae]|uniref:CoB--CoM heterodisulfide reductase iron-sulfur subunit A n=1 Tax=Anaeromyxobacter oryzae TaxID=2918170 RepID=A0ABN6MTT8_9BACT|nr:4Fe-4S dicluster domain-containing protein [Anaeromyxobacter oryzae]BDG03277.1 CoB--CoM heterodisulfide reductase iron-sulfur subunit A [Anaeromyxobacter oryzae]
MSDEASGGRGAQERGTGGRTGLYFCRCGPNLGNVVRLPELAEGEGWPGAADVAIHDVLCSPEGKAWLAARIREQGLERVVIGACSPREHEHTFRGVLEGAGRSAWHLAMVNLREQAEWIAGGEPGAVTARARALVSAALRRVALQRPIAPGEVDVSADVLVVGGGAAGISAALALAQERRKVVLVERAFVLGGLANQLDEIFPDLECASCFMEPALDRVLHDDRIEVLTGAEVTRVRGAAGRFTVELAIAPRSVDPAACLGCGECAKACPAESRDPYAGGLGTRRAIHLPYAGCLPHVSVVDRAACRHHGGRGRGPDCDLCASACAFGAIRLDEAPAVRSVEVGAIVVATGLEPGAADGPEGVVSSYQLERMLHPNGPTAGAVRGVAGEVPRAILLAATATDDGAELAAREILKLAHLVKARLPDARVTVAGGLDRAPQLARVAAELAAEGVELVPGALVDGGVTKVLGGLSVRLSAPGGIETRHAADLVVVHAAPRPAVGSAALARLLRIDSDAAGFFLDGAAGPFEPTATRIGGVYVAGGAAGPRTIHQAIRDGAAAAGQVLSSLLPGEKKALEPLAVDVEADLCGGCGICASACPFGAVVIQPGVGKAKVEAVHCRGCGTCAAACPTGAASARHYTRAQIEAEISALLAAGGA